jgi:tetratricopeptide (TPR) repeat protein
MNLLTPQQVFAAGDRLFEEGRPLEAVSEHLRAFTGENELAEALRERLRACFVAHWGGVPRDPELDAADYVALARAHSDGDRIGKALAVLGKAAAIAPDSGDVHLRLGEACFLGAFDAGERKPLFDRAIDHLSAAVLFGITDPSPERLGELQYLVGAAHFFREEHEEAVENLRTAAEMHPGKSEAWFFLGSALRRLGRPAEAAANLERACAVAADAYNLQQLGNCYSELGRFDEALARLREARELSPLLVDLHRDIGVAVIQQAELAFDRDVRERLAAGSPAETLRVGDFLQRPDVQEAMGELRTFVERAETMPDETTRKKVRLLRGTAAAALPTDRLRAGKQRRRSEGFAFVGFGSDAPRVTIKDDIVRDPLAADMRAASERVALFEGAAERSARDCSDLGLTWFHRGLFGAAMVAFSEALEKDESAAEVHQYLGAAWSHLGDDARSVRHTEEALRRGARLVEPHRELGLFYLSQSADALPPLDEESELDKDLRRTLDLLRAVRQGAHREKALEHLRAYAELSGEDELAGFIRRLVSTADGEDETLQGVFGMAVDAALARDAFALAERLLLALGDVLSGAGKEALRDRLEDVRRLRRTSAHIHHERGNVLMSTGRLTAAMEQWGRALELEPDLDKTHFNLAMALYESGHGAEALPHVQRFLELRSDAGGAVPDFTASSPGALEQRLQWGDAARKMQRAEQEASILLVKLQTFQSL